MRPRQCGRHVEHREYRMNEFLNPKSMLTPGAAGSMVMLITNALCASFAFGKPQWLALLLSFVFGAFVLSSVSLKKALKLGLWFINSLIIFSVSVGTAKFAAERAENVSASTSVPTATGSSAAVEPPGLLALLVPSAVAQQVPTATPADQAAEQQKQLIERLLRENQALKEQLLAKQAAVLSPPAPVATPQAAQLDAAPQALAVEQQAQLEAARLQQERAALAHAKAAEARSQKQGGLKGFFKHW